MILNYSSDCVYLIVAAPNRMTRDYTFSIVLCIVMVRFTRSHCIFVEYGALQSGYRK